MNSLKFLLLFTFSSQLSGYVLENSLEKNAIIDPQNLLNDQILSDNVTDDAVQRIHFLYEQIKSAQNILKIDDLSTIDQLIDRIRSSQLLNVSSNKTTNINGSVQEAYLALLVSAETAYLTSIIDLLSSFTNITQQNSKDFLQTVGHIRNATFTANQTINSLFKIAEDFNVTSNCSIPDLHSVLNSSLAKSIDEYISLVESLTLEYERDLKNLNFIFREVTSISKQITDCIGHAQCEYLFEKIARKTSAIPLYLERQGNSTAASLYQSVTAVWKSGARIVRDVSEDLIVPIVKLKNCIQLNLYD